MPSNSIIDPDSGAGFDYTSLAAAISGEAGDMSGLGEIVFKCRCTGGTADGAAVVTGFTNTSSSDYLKIWTDPAEGYRFNPTSPFPASGNIYRIDAASASNALAVQANYTKLMGLACRTTNTSGAFSAITINVFGVQEVDIGYCFATKTYSNYASSINLGQGSSVSIVGARVYNCLIDNTGGGKRGIQNSSDTDVSFFIFNCTVIGCSDYGIFGYSNTHVYNCVLANNGDDYFNTPYGTITNCASDDGDGTNPQTLNSASSYAAEFTNYAGGDYSLVATSVCIGNGTDDPGSGIYSDDILGNARSSTWDIGAFEYVAGGGGISIPVVMHYRRMMGVS